MRRTGVFARLTMLMSPVLHGQKAASNVDLSCVDSLELPTRDLFAARAPQGEVSVAMNLSQFGAKCHDRTTDFGFAFTL